MLHAGLLREVAALVLDRRLAPNTVAAKAIGYRQTLEYLALSRAQRNSRAFREYLTSFTTATRNYAKRQLHWYRKDTSFLWMQIQRRRQDPAEDEPHRRVLRELCHWKDIGRYEYTRMVKHQVCRAEAVAKMREWVKKKPKGMKRGVLTDFDWLAVAAMVAAGEIRTPQGRAILGEGEAQVVWATTAFAAPGEGSNSGSPGSRRAVLDSDASDEDALQTDEMLDEDDALELLALHGTRGSVPRTLPEFPDPPLPPSEWTAEDVLIRAAESNSGSKGQRTPMANKLREYSFNDAAAAARLEVLADEVEDLATRLREQVPDLLSFSPDRARPRAGSGSISRSRSHSPPAPDTVPEAP